MDQQLQPRERRQAPRYSCAGQAEIVVPGRGLRYPGRIANLSAAGCRIETGCCLERGTSVEIWMNAEGLPLRLAANLMVRRGGSAGFRFTNVSPRQLHQIRSLIAELAQPQPSLPETPALAAPAAASEIPSPPARLSSVRRPSIPNLRDSGWLAAWLRKLISRIPC